MSVKRFDFDSGRDGFYEENTHGDWVRWEDCEQLIAEAAKYRWLLAQFEPWAHTGTIGQFYWRCPEFATRLFATVDNPRYTLTDAGRAMLKGKDE